MERRTCRSGQRHEALGLFLESLRKQQGLEAIALVEEDGFLIAGAGEGDLEHMGAVAAGHTGTVQWNQRTVYVQALEHHGARVYLATPGKPLAGADAAESVNRILAAA